MKKKLLKIALSSTGTTLLLAGVTIIPLTSCSSNTVQNIDINRYPQSFNINKVEFNKICNLINNHQQEFNNPEYIEANKYVLNAIKNTLSNEQKEIVNTNTINQKNYVTNIDAISTEQFLIISTVLNNKKYSFSFNRQNGDIFYGGNNKPSVNLPNINENQWTNLLNYNNSQFTQKFLEDIYKKLCISITLNNGNLSPWLTNGFYDGINQQVVFTLYGYYSDQPFNLETAIPICNIGIKPGTNNGIFPISKINPAVVQYNFTSIGKDFDTIWNKNKNKNLLNLINILNTFTGTTFNAVGGLIGNDQQIINGIETNISKLMQALGNVDKNTKTQINNFLVLLKNDSSKIEPKQINDILNQIIAICKDPNTYALYNKIANSLNQILGFNNYNQFINLQSFNNSLENAILNKNHYVVGNNFYSFIELFNGFGVNNVKDEVLKEKFINLWNLFIEQELQGWGLRLATKIANDWLMISTPNNIYFDTNFSSYSNINANEIKGELYLKIVNNTNETKIIKSSNNKVINVKPGEAFNFYLSIDKNNFVPYVYAENGQFKFGLKIKKNNESINSFFQYGVFDKDATNIETDETNFIKEPLNNDFDMSGMVSCGGNITNIKLNDIPKENTTPELISTISNEQTIADAVKNVFQTNFDNAINTFNDLSVITSAFSKEDNTVLVALTEAAPAINKVLVSLLNSIADLGNGAGGAITNLITIINALQPNGTNPPILNTLNGLLPNLKRILNYTPHLYKTLSDGKTVDMIGVFENGEFKSSNTKTFVEMIGNLIQGLLTSYKTTTTIDNKTVIDKNKPYALWDFLNDHISDLVGVVVSIGPIMQMIPNQITSSPITDNEQWKPTYPTNATSPLDAMLPVIIANFYDNETGAPISTEKMKEIIGGLDSIAPTIEGFLNNSGSVPPAIISLISNLIKNLASTAVDSPDGQPSNAKSLLMFVSENGQTIVDIVNGINNDIGKTIAAILTAFTGKDNDASNFLDVTIGQLNGHTQLSQSGTISTPSTPNNTIGTQVVMNFWERLYKNLETVNPQLANIANIMKTVGPIIGELLNSVSRPMKSDGTVYTSDELKQAFSVKFNKSLNQATINFAQPVYFDLTNVINTLPSGLESFFNANWNSSKYAIVLNGDCITYDLNGYNPSYSSDNKQYLLNGISAHLNCNQTNFSEILGFINFTKIQGLIKTIKPFINTLPIPQSLKTILNLALCDNDGSHFMYLLFNLLLPNFGSLLNLNIGTNNIDNNINEIDPNNYVVIDNELNNIQLSNIDANSIKNALISNSTFGSSFWNNVDKKLAFINVENSNNKATYTSLIPLVSIDKNFNRRLIKGIVFNLTQSGSTYNIKMEPIYADTTLTTLLKNLVFTLMSSDVIQKKVSQSAKQDDTIELTDYGNKLVEFIDSNLNSPITNSLLNDFGGSIKNNNIPYTINVGTSPNYLQNTTSDIALANLVESIKQTNWTTSTNYDILNKLINDNVVNKLIKVSVGNITNGTLSKKNQQSITLKIPNSILTQYKSSTPTTTTNVTFNITWDSGTTPSNVISVGSTIPTDANIDSFVQTDPKVAMNSLVNTLYNVAINSSGIAAESNMGTIVSNILQFVNACMGYFPTLNNIAKLINNEDIQKIISGFINNMFINANNDSWWIDIEKLISLIINKR